MPGNTILINELESRILDHFQDRFVFQKATAFYWSASHQEVHFKPAAKLEDVWQLLHEIAHASLDHRDYIKDIELVQQERTAWHYAKTVIAPLFGVVIDESFAEDHLDSYRDWMHARSKCPKCTHTGIQQTTSLYQCINCLCSWSVNDARQKRLRRITQRGQNRSDQQVFAE